MKSNNDVIAMCWPVEALSEALEGLARRSGLRPKPADRHCPPQSPGANGEGFGEWLEVAAARLDLEACSVEAAYPDVTSFLKKCGPAIVRIDVGEQRRYLAVIGAGKRIRVLAPDLSTKLLHVDQVRDALCNPLEASILPEIERLASLSSLDDRHRQTAVKALLRQHLGSAQIGGCWLVRLAEDASLWNQVREH